MSTDCAHFQSYSVKCVWCFMLSHLMMSWDLNIWQVKIWLSREPKRLLKWNKKNIFPCFMGSLSDIQNKLAKMYQTQPLTKMTKSKKRPVLENIKLCGLAWIHQKIIIWYELCPELRQIILSLFFMKCSVYSMHLLLTQGIQNKIITHGTFTVTYLALNWNFS